MCIRDRFQSWGAHRWRVPKGRCGSGVFEEGQRSGPTPHQLGGLGRVVTIPTPKREISSDLHKSCGHACLRYGGAASPCAPPWLRYWILANSDNLRLSWFRVATNQIIVFRTEWTELCQILRRHDIGAFQICFTFMIHFVLKVERLKRQIYTYANFRTFRCENYVRTACAKCLNLKEGQ